MGRAYRRPQASDLPRSWLVGFARCDAHGSSLCPTRPRPVHGLRDQRRARTPDASATRHAHFRRDWKQSRMRRTSETHLHPRVRAVTLSRSRGPLSLSCRRGARQLPQCR